jgi:hypothetical protein
VDLAVAALDLVLDAKREPDRLRGLAHQSDFVLPGAAAARLDISVVFRQ